MDFKELNENLEKILNKLDTISQDTIHLKENVETFAITEMAQRQGNDGTFEYYTLDNEYVSHKPHVHVCVSNNDKYWKGKPLRSGNPLKSIASVVLYPDDRQYTKENIQFEDVADTRIDSNKYKKIIAEWLNAKRRNEANSIKCIDDYLMSNQDFYEREMYVNYLQHLS